MARELWPEGLVVLEELPESAGGKVAKQALREDAARRFGTAGILGTDSTVGGAPDPARDPDPV